MTELTCPELQLTKNRKYTHNIIKPGSYHDGAVNVTADDITKILSVNSKEIDRGRKIPIMAGHKSPTKDVRDVLGYVTSLHLGAALPDGWLQGIFEFDEVTAELAERVGQVSIGYDPKTFMINHVALTGRPEIVGQGDFVQASEKEKELVELSEDKNIEIEELKAELVKEKVELYSEQMSMLNQKFPQAKVEELKLILLGTTDNPNLICLSAKSGNNSVAKQVLAWAKTLPNMVELGALAGAQGTVVPSPLTEPDKADLIAANSGLDRILGLNGRL